VARLVSSDGFLLLRGKNARGNRRLLKMGRPFDLWLHAEDGPGAHLIIRLSHAAEEPPASTLREAAILVGEKSWQRDAARARVMVARLRHVHAVRGAEPGTVRVDRIEQRLCVSLDRSGQEDGEEYLDG
jgi:predicted ribosome quality control (RQC) complex YloA/Tae2 family protein